ncbi:sulfur oxidation c-type cytochrome SoxA [Pseudoduganella sp. RAF53_2]|uniref:sulfur oxidation c-type cytochrome SoxA n=1 Tax=unclassified Pseudoduganella TaxID=2637179 RepID=UPI003F9CF557
MSLVIVLAAAVLGVTPTANPGGCHDVAATSSTPVVEACRHSGAEYMSPATQTMQRDDSQNPAMLWIASGEALWRTPAVATNKSCATCHNDAKASMRDVATHFPRFSKGAGKVITLSDQINICRQGALKAPPFKAESEDLLALESYIAMQSRGMPMNPPDDAETRASATRGQKLFTTRMGQINLSCAQCHDDNAGKRLAGALIPQAHANAYPIYRLEWQSMGSLQRRLRNCMNGVRAEVPPFGAQDLIDLEAWLALRAKGMPLETPGVRP